MGRGDILTVGVASAVSFRGDTAPAGWSSGTNTAGALERVSAEPGDGFLRLVFAFGEGGLPDYEIGYANEPVLDVQGAPQATAGRETLRLWFRYPRPETPPYAGEPRMTIADGGNVNAVLLNRADSGHLIWTVDLDAKAGFEVSRSDDGRSLRLELFAPEHAFNRLPEVGVGSTDRVVLALADRLAEEGYLDARPAAPLFDETLRLGLAAFEADHGLVPDGVAAAETWALLLRDAPPERSGTAGRDIVRAKRALAAQEGPSQVTPLADAPVNIRSGPGLDYSATASLAPGQFVDVTGILQGSDPATTWYEVCCLEEQRGWVRADVVRLFGPGEVPPAAEPPAEGDLGGIRPANRPAVTAEGNPILYFTFDDGPMPDDTRAVMDILEANGGRGTFFVIGRQVNWLPDLVREAVERGHSVQNHTYNHASLDAVDRSGFFSEVESTQNAIFAAADTWATCLRPPYGATDGFTFQLAGELGLDVVLWTLDTQDWTRPGTQVIVDYILANAQPGAIVLMHDGGGNRVQTLAALEAALPQLRRQGYVFASLCPNQ
jgi:peptidoglycan/xylan/chitin deacetylase (PgdA/CDA1 family)